MPFRLVLCLSLLVSVVPAQELTLAVDGPATGPSALWVQLTATYDGPLSPDTYDWDFGDGQVLTGAEATVGHLYAASGTYDVTVSATQNGAGPSLSVPGAVIVGPSDSHVRWHTIAGPGGYESLAENVAIDGDTLVFAAGSSSTDHHVVVYERAPDGSWGFHQELDLGAPVQPGDVFVTGLAIDGDTIMVGRYVSFFPVTAVVMVYERGGDGDFAWVQDLGVLGLDMSIDGDWAAIGDPGETGGPHTSNGFVYLYQRQPSGTWHQVQRFEGASGFEYLLGMSVALDADRLVIGGANTLRTALRQPDDSWQLIPDVPPPAGVDTNDYGQTIRFAGDTACATGSIGQQPLIVWHDWDGTQWVQGDVTLIGVSTLPVNSMHLSQDRLVFSQFTYNGRCAGVWVHERLPDGTLSAPRQIQPDADHCGALVAMQGDELLIGVGTETLDAPGGVFLVEHVRQDDLGFGGPEALRLEVTGGDLTTAPSSATLSLLGGAPSTSVFLVVGLGLFDPPLFAQGGLLVPTPDVILEGLATNALGSAFLQVPAAGGGLVVTLNAQAITWNGPGTAVFSNAVAIDVDL